MEQIWVSFSDSAEQTINAFFGIDGGQNQQSTEQWPYQASLSTSDYRWKAYYDAQWPMIQNSLPAPTAT